MERWQIDSLPLTKGAHAGTYPSECDSLFPLTGGNAVLWMQVLAARPQESALRRVLDKWAGAASAMPGERDLGGVLGPFDLPYPNGDLPQPSPGNDPDDLDQVAFLRDSYFADFCTEGEPRDSYPEVN